MVFSTQNLQGDEDGDDGDLSSDTDSDDEKRHTVNKAQVNAFHERQKEAERKKPIFLTAPATESGFLDNSFSCQSCTCTR